MEVVKKRGEVGFLSGGIDLLGRRTHFWSSWDWLLEGGKLCTEGGLVVFQWKPPIHEGESAASSIDT